jgi:hypothetical protein
VHFVSNAELASAIVDPEEALPETIVQVRSVAFGMPVTVTAVATVPGTNSAGWPRSSGAGSKRFCRPTGIETGSSLAFR